MRKLHNIQWHQNCKTTKPHEPEIKQMFTSIIRAKARATEISKKLNTTAYVDWNNQDLRCCYTNGIKSSS